MQEKLFRYLEHNKTEAIFLLSKLIEIPTVNPPGENYEEMVAFLEKQCRKLGLKTKKYLTPKSILNKYGINAGSKRISLVSDWPANSKRTLHINSHYDVVPATGKWKTPPFEAVVRGNRVYGRGSEDMKGNIASILFALQAIKRCSINPRLNIQVSFTPDEEVGGRTGLGYLVKNNLVKADYAMSEGDSKNYVSMGNKGVIWAEVAVRGKSAHASLPHRGVNAFEKAALLAAMFEKLKQKISKQKTRYCMKDGFSRRASFVMGGLLEGGVKINVIPDMVKFSIDRRLIPEEDVNVAKAQMGNLIKRFNSLHKDSEARVKFVLQENSSISKQDKNFFKTVSDSIKLVTGERPKFSILSGATDIRYFMWKGVSTLGYSVRGGEGWHSDNEFVYIDSLIDTAKVYALIMGTLE